MYSVNIYTKHTFKCDFQIFLCIQVKHEEDDLHLYKLTFYQCTLS
jgi:hypothetical protein